uniref:Glutaredoxin-1 n=1 Tax=Meloidogyne enterolobii TaxID=390850 RepID=A0A6V7U296_MELEN|nr:unnamed protein product [Meloidogyne enterolobii]
MADVTPKSFVDSLIKTNKVVVFSKSYCPYCTKAKEALTTFSLVPGTMEVVEIEDRGDCDKIQDYLKEITGQRSVPRVFIGGNFLAAEMTRLLRLNLESWKLNCELLMLLLEEREKKNVLIF